MNDYSYIDRMVEERSELTTRIIKARAALDNSVKFQLDELQRDLLKAQIDAMQTYHSILTLRIKNENAKKDGIKYV